MKLEKNCTNCRYCHCDWDNVRCGRCDNYSLWKLPHWLEEWLNSFDTNSATKCFEAVNLLKQRLEGEDEKADTR